MQAHTAGHPDVYDNPDGTINYAHEGPDGYQCVMERHQPDYMKVFYEDVLHGRMDPFCDSCRNSITEKLNANPYSRSTTPNQ